MQRLQIFAGVLICLGASSECLYRHQSNNDWSITPSSKAHKTRGGASPIESVAPPCLCSYLDIGRIQFQGQGRVFDDLVVFFDKEVTGCAVTIVYWIGAKSDRLRIKANSFIPLLGRVHAIAASLQNVGIFTALLQEEGGAEKEARKLSLILP